MYKKFTQDDKIFEFISPLKPDVKNIFKGKRYDKKDGSETEIAVKRVELQLLSRSERRILNGKRLPSHPNVLTYEAEYIEYGTSFFVMEIYDCDLFTFLNERVVSKNEKLELCKKICEAVKFIHSNGVVHRDIKLENILVRKNGEELVLADFGFSTDLVTERSEISRRYKTGSPLYMAPELIIEEPYPYRTPDFWATAVCFYYIFFGKYPFFARNVESLFSKIIKYEYEPIPDDASEYEKQIIQRSFVHFKERVCIYNE